MSTIGWKKSSLATSSLENIEKFYTFDKPLGNLTNKNKIDFKIK